MTKLLYVLLWPFRLFVGIRKRRFIDMYVATHTLYGTSVVSLDNLIADAHKAWDTYRKTSGFPPA